ncbi:MAG: hypothetical protein EAZ07_02695 [Cytophagales bacterium]|nr:MAG: hypothetical protein EAZ07_02695 [Cytophagales bacterium]
MNNQSTPQQAEENIQLQPGSIDNTEESNHIRISIATSDVKKNNVPNTHHLEAPDFSKSPKNYKKAWITENNLFNHSYFSIQKLILFSVILIVSLLFFIVF